MSPLFNIFTSGRDKPSANMPPKITALSQDSYEEDFSDSQEEDTSGPLRFMPRENFKTNIGCILFTCLSHYLYGIFFNAYESVNARYDYPNFGSMCFVLATALILIRFDLSLKSLPIESRSGKYSLYKILAVTFLTHLILAGIWQQLVNLTWELFFAAKDLMEVMNGHAGKGLLHVLSGYITPKTASFLTHIEGLTILAIVMSSSAD